MPEPLRVLAVGTVYPPRHLGGYEVIWRGVTEHLRATGHECRVLVTDYAGPDPGTSDDPGVHRELRWYWRDHEWPAMDWRARLRLERHNAVRLEHHLAEFDPHVVAWWPVGGLSLSLIERVRRARRRSVLFVLDPWPRYGPERDLWLHGVSRLGPAARLARPLTGIPGRVDWPRAGRWVFCSAALRADVAAAGIDPPGSVVLHPGVEERFVAAPPSPPRPWRGRLLYVGRVVEPKGVHTAVAALAALPEAELTVVGPGDRPYRERLRGLAANAGAGDRLHLREALPREALPELMREADAVVFPVQWPEPWGLVPLEAMGVGTPVIATGTGGSGEYLRDGENALLFRAGDPEALAAVVRRLAGDTALRERLRAGGRGTAEALGEAGFNAAAEAVLRAAAAGTAP